MCTEVGWDGCPSCFGCPRCVAVDGDCCDDCTYESEFTRTRVHDCPTCHCDGGTIAVKYWDQVCNCEGHNCDEEASNE